MSGYHAAWSPGWLLLAGALVQSCSSAPRYDWGAAEVVHRMASDGAIIEAGLMVGTTPVGCWLRRHADGENRELTVYESGHELVHILIDDSTVTGSPLSVDVMVKGTPLVWSIYNDQLSNVCCRQLVGARQSGLWLMFWGSGGVHMVGPVSHDLRQGRWRVFNQDARLFMDGDCLDGKRVGVWRVYDEEGEARHLSAAEVDRIHGW